jgi:hypothetical protein
MHIPRQVARIATAMDPVIRDVRPLDRSMMGLPKRLQNSIIRNIPGASKTLPARYGPTGEEVVRPGGMGVGGKLMRTFSPIQVSPERPGRELEGLMAEIGYVPGEMKPYITIRGEQILLEHEDLEVLRTADHSRRRGRPVEGGSDQGHLPEVPRPRTPADAPVVSLPPPGHDTAS